jgi:hypothetical protein
LTAGIEEVLLKALEKSPQERYQTGSELIATLKKALAVKPVKTRMPLPLLPVGVPTISRRSLSKESVTRRVASAPIAGYTPQKEPQAPADQKLSKEQGRHRARWGMSGFSKAWFLFFSLLFLAALSFAWAQGWFQPGAFSKIVPLQPAQPTIAVLQATDLPTPIEAQTLFPFLAAPLEETVVPLSSPPATYTPVAIDASPATQIASPTMLPVNFSNGHLFKLYYDENSFYMHNLSRVTRSISGFTFERLNDQDEVLNFFGGWDWGLYYANITPDRCMAIELYLSRPFLKPSECEEPYLSIINPPRETNKIFWTAQENSHEFRVLWQRSEVARCPLGWGVCEFRVP